MQHDDQQMGQQSKLSNVTLHCSVADSGLVHEATAQLKTWQCSPYWERHLRRRCTFSMLCGRATCRRPSCRAPRAMRLSRICTVAMRYSRSRRAASSMSAERAGEGGGGSPGSASTGSPDAAALARSATRLAATSWMDSAFSSVCAQRRGSGFSSSCRQRHCCHIVRHHHHWRRCQQTATKKDIQRPTSTGSTSGTDYVANDEHRTRACLV